MWHPARVRVKGQFIRRDVGAAHRAGRPLGNRIGPGRQPMPGVDSPWPIARVGGAGSRARQGRVLHRVRSPARGVPGLKHRGRIRSANGKEAQRDEGDPAPATAGRHEPGGLQAAYAGDPPALSLRFNPVGVRLAADRGRRRLALMVGRSGGRRRLARFLPGLGGWLRDCRVAPGGS